LNWERELEQWAQKDPGWREGGGRDTRYVATVGHKIAP